MLNSKYFAGHFHAQDLSSSLVKERVMKVSFSDLLQALIIGDLHAEYDQRLSSFGVYMNLLDS